MNKRPEREIKFRAWDNNSKVMVFDGIEVNSHGKFTVLDGFNDYVVACNGDDMGSEFVLMQYTGLHDKNGKEIYEGDIVRREWWLHAPHIGVVEYREGEFGVSGDASLNNIVNSAPLYQPEVIGNIYENPELLDEQEAGRSEL